MTAKPRSDAYWWAITESGELSGPLTFVEYLDGGHIGETYIVDHTKVRDAEVSTSFLGLDFAIAGSTQPVLFETYIVGGKWADRSWRYHTLEAARAGHRQVVAAVKAGRDVAEIEVKPS